MQINPICTCKHINMLTSTVTLSLWLAYLLIFVLRGIAVWVKMRIFAAAAGTQLNCHRFSVWYFPGHIGIAVPDVYAACKLFEEQGVPFVKKPNDGKSLLMDQCGRFSTARWLESVLQAVLKSILVNFCPCVFLQQVK